MNAARVAELVKSAADMAYTALDFHAAGYERGPVLAAAVFEELVRVEREMPAFRAQRQDAATWLLQESVRANEQSNVTPKEIVIGRELYRALVADARSRLGDVPDPPMQGKIGTVPYRVNGLLGSTHAVWFGEAFTVIHVAEYQR